jgi:nucleoside-diphosphate-sugar epimerase
VRPDVIYGTRDRQFVPRVARALRTGVVPLVGNGSSTLAVVHAANVADGIVRAAGLDAALGRAYNLANDYDVTVAEFVRLAGQGLGRRIVTFPVPMLVARGVVRLASSLAAVALGRNAGLMARSALDFITRDNPFSSDRARRELGWEPPVRPEVGIPEAFRWVKQDTSR